MFPLQDIHHALGVTRDVLVGAPVAAPAAHAAADAGRTASAALAAESPNPGAEPGEADAEGPTYSNAGRGSEASTSAASPAAPAVKEWRGAALTSRVTRCKSAAELAGVCRRHLRSLNAITTSAAIVKLAQLSEADQGSRRAHRRGAAGTEASTESAGRWDLSSRELQALLSELVDSFCQHARSQAYPTARQYANAVWAVGQLVSRRLRSTPVSSGGVHPSPAASQVVHSVTHEQQRVGTAQQVAGVSAVSPAAPTAAIAQRARSRLRQLGGHPHKHTKQRAVASSVSQAEGAAGSSSAVPPAVDQPERGPSARPVALEPPAFARQLLELASEHLLAGGAARLAGAQPQV
jgi:hypothetical protein